MGQNLARQALNEHRDQIPYYLFYSSRKSAARRHFQDGVESGSAWGGCEIKKFVRHGDGSIRKIIRKNWFIRNPHPGSDHCLDAETLLEAAQILADSSVYREHVSPVLYGPWDCHAAFELSGPLQRDKRA